LGISVEKELWIETKSAEGKSYFYQSETRQTVWERPDASNAVVMQQDEIQKAVDQSQREEKGWLFFITFFHLGCLLSSSLLYQLKTLYFI